jgi:stage V sporulation protein AE
MDIFLKFLYAFLAGGALCTVGQILVLKTNFTPARILVCFVTLGVILQAATLFEPIKKAVGSGITVPITGFGGTLAKGAMEAVKNDGFLGILTGGITAAAAGVAIALVAASLVSLVARSRSK